MVGILAALVAFLVPASSVTSPPPPGLAWGAPTEGLQMAFDVDWKNEDVHVWLRNATDRSISYNGYRRGYFGAVRLEYQSGRNWFPLKRLNLASRTYENVGPTQLNEQTLTPHETIPFFTDYPGDFVWPAEALIRPSITIRLRQELNKHQTAKEYERGEGALFVLYSGPVTISSIQLRNDLAKRAADIKAGRMVAPDF